MKHGVSGYKELLEVAKAQVIITGLGTFSPDKYWNTIEKQGIINDKAKDVIDNGDGTYKVITVPGYVFNIELTPNEENPKGAIITYEAEGKTETVAPNINKIETIISQTSITVKAIMPEIENAELSYYYKLSTEDDSKYKEIKVEEGKTEAVITGITANASYIVKVIAKSEQGETALTKEVTCIYPVAFEASVAQSQIAGLYAGTGDWGSNPNFPRGQQAKGTYFGWSYEIPVYLKEVSIQTGAGASTSQLGAAYRNITYQLMGSKDGKEYIPISEEYTFPTYAYPATYPMETMYVNSTEAYNYFRLQLLEGGTLNQSGVINYNMHRFKVSFSVP